MKVLRTLLWLGIAVVVAVSAAWLADNPEAVVLNWGGYRIETSAAVTVGLAVLFLLLLTGVAKFWRWLGRGTPALRESRRRKGYRVLTRGLVAVAAGEGDEANRHAKRAKSLIKEDQPLTLVLLAQAAQLSGDSAAAQKYFNRMLDNPETEFLGLRGLIMDASRKGDTGTALILARRAEALRPHAPWINSTLFELQTQSGLWADAHKTIERSGRKRQVPPPLVKRRKALVLFQKARQEAAAGDAVTATDAALRAVGLAPDFPPAAALAARLVASGRPRKATRIIERAWRTMPHPDLAEAYVELSENDPPARRLKRVTRLAGMNPGHGESRLAVAEQALDAGLWGVAWNNLKPLVDGVNGSTAHPGARACRLMARYQQGKNGDQTAAAEWEARAQKADDGLVWRCTQCGHTGPEWLALCPGCEGFDTARWQGVVDLVTSSSPLSATSPGPPFIIDPSEQSASHG